MNKQSIVKKMLEDNKVEAILFHSFENRYWYSRFKSSMGYLLVTKRKSYLFLDGRYITAAKNQKDLQNIDELRHFGNNVFDQIKEILKENKVESLAFESDWTIFQQYENFKKIFTNQKLIAIDTSKLRIVKDKWEIKQIKKACDITNTVFQEVLKWVRPGITEKELARYVSDRFFANGADKLSFDTIVASGINGSMPHAVPSDKKLKLGELITLDMGCFYNGYCSDQTRTFALGKLNQKLIDIYNVVYDAQSLGISLVKAGKSAGEIHKEVFDFIDKKGYGKYFDHGLGHGIGIEVHEEPYENLVSKTILKENMTITVEPGIYIPNLGGVRIEDDILVTKKGNKFLTTSNRKLIFVK